MKDSKLIHLLKTFTQKELNLFEQYLLSSFFNTNKKSTLLFMVLKQYYPQFLPEKVDKKRIIKILFPEKNEINSSLSVLMSHLTRLIEDFLIYEEGKQNTHLKKRLLLTVYNHRQEKFFLHSYKELLTEIEMEQSQGATYYQNLYEQEVILQQYNSIHLKNELPITTEKINYDFDVYIILTKLKNYSNIINNYNITGLEYNKQEVEFWIQYIHLKNLTSIPSVNLLYTNLLVLMDKSNTAHYKTLKQLLFVTPPILNDSEIRAPFQIAINYCNQKVYEGNLEYYQEMFELYEHFLKTELIYEGDYIPPLSIKNIVTLGIILKKTDWTHRFILDYKNSIEPKFRESAYNFNMGAYFFYKQNFTKAMQFLIQVEYFEPAYAFDCRTLLLRAYYELNESESFISLAESFKQFVKNNKSLSSERKNGYLNFIKFAIKLFKIKHIYNKKTRSNLKLAIIACNNISSRTWLLEKTNV